MWMNAGKAGKCTRKIVVAVATEQPAAFVHVSALQGVVMATQQSVDAHWQVQEGLFGAPRSTTHPTHPQKGRA